MKEHGLLCTSSVALAMHEGRQTQDRRPMNPQPTHSLVSQSEGYSGSWYGHGECNGKSEVWKCPVQVGDIFYVKETWTGTWCYESMHIVYAADGTERTIEIPEVPADYALPKVCLKPGKWASPFFMTPWAARTRKRVTGIRVEHGPEISEEDAIAEGAEAIDRRDGLGSGYKHGGRAEWPTASESFRALWHDLYGDDKPWRWVYELGEVGK